MNPADRDERETPLQEVLDSLAVAYDEALSAGSTPLAADETEVPRELLPRLRSVQACVSLLYRAGRTREESTLGSPSSSAPLQVRWDLPQPENRIGRFEIVRELGRGGHGVVFLAFDTALWRHVALKVPRPEVMVSSELSRRFMREARAAGALEHPNLIRVLEVGQDGAVCFIASAYCEGPTLAQWLASRSDPVPVRLAAELIKDLAAGVEHAHAHGILHRDIKPSNVLLEEHPAGARLTPKLTDFGLARLAQGDGEATRSGTMIGTASYMAPEQVSGLLADVGNATDVYALGTVLYELLTGQRAFQGASDVDTLRRVVVDEPVPPRRLRGDVPRDLEAICLKCLDKRPARRYASAELLAQDLGRFLAGEPTLARPLGWNRKLVRWARRRPATAALVAVSCASLLLLVVGLAWHSATLAATLAISEQRRDLAETMRQRAERSGRAALEQERLANEHLYASRMKLAYTAAEHGDLTTVDRLLEQYQPPSAWSTLRGFEWYYLNRRLHGERFVRTAHDEAYAAAFSPDGTVLATGGQDGRIRFWDPHDLTPRETLLAHSSCVNSLAFSPDGRQLASGGCDNTVRLWSVDARRELATLLVHENFISSVACSKDGRWLACVADDGTIVVWELQTRSPAAKLRVEVDAWIAWSPDSTQLAAGTTVGAVRFWETGTWKQQGTIVVGTMAGAYCGDAQTLALATMDNTLELWNPLTQSRLSVLQRDNVEKLLTVAPSGDWLLNANGFDSHLVCLWDFAAVRQSGSMTSPDAQAARPFHAASPRRVLLGNDAAIKDASFSPDEEVVATVSRDGALRVFDVQEVGVSVPVLRFEAISLDVDRELDRVAIVDGVGSVALWDVSDPGNPIVLSKPAVAAGTDDVSLTADASSLVAYSHATGDVEVLDLAPPNARRTLEAHPGGVAKAFLSANGSTLATQGYDHVLRVYEVSTGRQQFTTQLPSVGESPSSKILEVDGARLALTPDGKWLLTAGWSQAPSGVLMIDLKTREERRFDTPLDMPTFSPSGDLLACTVFGSGVRIVDLSTGQVAASLHGPASVASMAFSPNAQTLATGTADGHIRLWHTATGQEMGDLGAYTGLVSFLKFSTDGTRLAAVVEQFRNEQQQQNRWREPVASELYIWRCMPDSQAP